MTELTTKNCPICNQDNKCGNLVGKPSGTCWCIREAFSKELFELIPSDQLGISCVCKDCLDNKNGEHDIM